MNRIKKHRVKTEQPETSTSHRDTSNDYDLTYYIHDRVELMHQVFSVLKHKEIKTMAPECVRHISIDDLQELCTEELLGISSKRLCAILDGAEPPSDTESSSESPERVETISLDSISSDEEILSASSSVKNKKHKRHHRDSKKTRRKKAKEPQKVADSADGTGAEADQSRAARAGLTVLELLELQARARAIRAQLQQEQAAKKNSIAEPAAASSHHSSDNEVEIKEEPAEVVEISSEDEKPDVGQLKEKSPAKEQPSTTDNGQAITKRKSDLIITVPQTKQSRKIKLNRNSTKITVSVSNNDNAPAAIQSNTVIEAVDTISNTNNDKTTNGTSKSNKSKDKEAKNNSKTSKDIEDAKSEKDAKIKKKQRKKDKKKAVEKDSDGDEITLQLSDTEKMDLLEDLDRKIFEKVSSSGSEDSESSSSDSSDDNDSLESTAVDIDCKSNEDSKKNKESNKIDVPIVEVIDGIEKDDDDVLKSTESTSVNELKDTVVKEIDPSSKKSSDDVQFVANEDTSETISKESHDVCEVKSNDDVMQSNNDVESQKNEANGDKDTEVRSENVDKAVDVITIDDIPIVNDDSATVRLDSKIDDNVINENTNKHTNEDTKEREMSDGEISGKSGSEVEALDLKPEIVCISDTEETTEKKKSEKKKKKKDKKSKKSKKSKSDFQVSGDQNFVDKPEITAVSESTVDSVVNVVEIVDTATALSLEDNDEDVCEILELSDDSSCYEVDGTCLSKEPTAEEIEALSAKIDEIERDDVVTEEEIREHERALENKTEDLENISWKDRYLDSKKVKSVLTTSNIFNALRKKNRDLKRKLEESKKIEAEAQKEIVEKPEIEAVLVEGSIEQYKTLQGSTKFIDPVPDVVKSSEVEESSGNTVDTGQETANSDVKTDAPQKIKEMAKDAKVLLKMYKKLLKYNDMNRQKDPNKKKKKKNKKKSKDGAPVKNI